MGKPFSRELEQADKIYNWAATVNFPFKEHEIPPIFNHQTLFVGSGGSLSACHLGAKLHERFGHIGKAITPLELLQSSDIIPGSNIVLLSASGKNSDILKACDIAKTYGANYILSLIMTTDSILAKKTNEYEYSTVLDFDIPTGKDGFLATNTLIAFFTILFRLYKVDVEVEVDLKREINSNSFIEKLHPDFTLVILHSGWSSPIAYDIESKFSEAGLGNVLITDYRNFAHGRHNWFDKKKKQSAIVELITPEIKTLSDKTIRLLPKRIPVLKIESDRDDPTAAIELLLKSFTLAEQIGMKVGIDPGRPGVPDYGSKIYHLSYPKNLIPVKKEIQEQLWVTHKTGISNLALLNESEQEIVVNSLNTFRKRINNEKFGGLIFDYDGTLCTAKERFSTPSNEIKKLLNDFLEKGYFVGIVTGRGKSVREALTKILSPQHLNQVVVGYYNGSQIAPLSDDTMPKNDIEKKANLLRCYDHLTKDDLLKKYIAEKKLSIELKAHMIEIQIKKDVFFPLKEMIKDLLVLSRDINSIKILESSHSIDIIDFNTSKQEIIAPCITLARKLDVSQKFICIGDRGSWPGNDYQLLSSEFSLSVDQASRSLETCWYLASPGVKGVAATKEYLKSIKYHKGYFKIKV